MGISEQTKRFANKIMSQSRWQLSSRLINCYLFTHFFSIFHPVDNISHANTLTLSVFTARVILNMVSRSPLVLWWQKCHISISIRSLARLHKHSPQPWEAKHTVMSYFLYMFSIWLRLLLLVVFSYCMSLVKATIIIPLNTTFFSNNQYEVVWPCGGKEWEWLGAT